MEMRRENTTNKSFYMSHVVFGYIPYVNFGTTNKKESPGISRIIPIINNTLFNKINQSVIFELFIL